MRVQFATSTLSVCALVPLSDAMDFDDPFRVVDVVEDAVVFDADTIAFLGCELFGADRPGRLRQRSDHFVDSLEVSLWYAPRALVSRAADDDPVHFRCVLRL